MAVARARDRMRSRVGVFIVGMNEWMSGGWWRGCVLRDWDYIDGGW